MSDNNWIEVFLDNEGIMIIEWHFHSTVSIPKMSELKRYSFELRFHTTESYRKPDVFYWDSILQYWSDSCGMHTSNWHIYRRATCDLGHYRDGSLKRFLNRLNHALTDI